MFSSQKIQSLNGNFRAQEMYDVNTSAKQPALNYKYAFELGQSGGPSATQTIKVNMATSSKFSTNSAPKAVAAALGTTLPKQFGKGNN